jgi:short-subunit dehydrogenase
MARPLPKYRADALWEWGRSSMKERALADRVVVLTGASSGFGRGAALDYARRGANLVLAARRGDELDQVAEECRALGSHTLVVPTDVSRKEDVEQLALKAAQTFEHVDVWINNAGVAALGPFERIPLVDHEQVIATDLLGVLYGSYFAYGQFLHQGWGNLINVASELGRTTVPYYTSYSAAKHGVVALGDALRQEIFQAKHENIHVCTVMPAAHDTPFFDHVGNYTGHEVQAPRPLHDPQDVVATLVRLATDPKDRTMVGADGVVKVLLKSFAPGISENLSAKAMQKIQMEGPPAADTPGAVQEPMSEGTEVSGGRRET